METLWHYVALFFSLAAVAGTAYWLQSEEADWWVYVELSQGRMPKFRLTWPEQLVVSGFVGALIAVPATVLVFAVKMLWSSRTRRRS